ncbi:hypothetical protein M9Y10_023235 [Tritrichomonas musculus]|uniref:Uncharacterized protein n=1 Tax=Tritrichomonas musculus TaxID=1915356 RepID=A0ABR2KWG1_9EUKA
MGIASLITNTYILIAGLLYPSFKQYYYYANFQKEQDRKKKGEPVDRKRIAQLAKMDLMVLSHFVTMTFFFTFTIFLDKIFTGIIYNAIKFLIVSQLIKNKYSGSDGFCKQVILRLNKNNYLFNLAKSANEGTSISAIQWTINALLQQFYTEYTHVLQEID